MADPITMMAAASAGTALVGGVMGGIGASQSGAASSSAYQYKARIALINKQINEQNARWALDAGGIKAEESGLKSRQEIASTKVAQSASGFEVNTGSNEAVRDTQSEVAQFDQNVIRWDAKKTSFGYLTKAATNEAESNLDTASARHAEEAGELGMWTSFISGAGSAANKWFQGNTIGIGSRSGGGGRSSGDSMDL